MLKCVVCKKILTKTTVFKHQGSYACDVRCFSKMNIVNNKLYCNETSRTKGPNSNGVILRKKAKID